MSAILQGTILITRSSTASFIRLLCTFLEKPSAIFICPSADICCIILYNKPSAYLVSSHQTYNFSYKHYSFILRAYRKENIASVNVCRNCCKEGDSVTHKAIHEHYIRHSHNLIYNISPVWDLPDLSANTTATDQIYCDFKASVTLQVCWRSAHGQDTCREVFSTIKQLYFQQTCSVNWTLTYRGCPSMQHLTQRLPLV